MAYVEELQGVHYDELIGGTAVTPLTANVVVAKLAVETAYNRGTLLGVVTESGKYAIVNSAAETGENVVAVVLAENAVIGTEEDTVVTVYTRGIFNREKLIVKADGDNADNHEEELCKVGIYLTSIKD